MALTELNIPAVIYRKMQISIPSTAAQTNYQSSTAVEAIDNYTPVAIAGWSWDSGTRQNWMLCFGLVINGGTIYYRFLNAHASGAASGVLQPVIVYVRNDFIGS